MENKVNITNHWPSLNLCVSTVWLIISFSAPYLELEVFTKTYSGSHATNCKSLVPYLINFTGYALVDIYVLEPIQLFTFSELLSLFFPQLRLVFPQRVPWLSSSHHCALKSTVASLAMLYPTLLTGYLQSTVIFNREDLEENISLLQCC